MKAGLQIIPMRKADALPKWTPPNNLKDAAQSISQLGRNMHEHAYLVGRTLLWVKKETGHGKFLAWLENNVWFGRVTAFHMMRFAKRCDSEGQTIEYHGHRSSKCLPGKHLPSKKPPPQKTDPRAPESALYFDIVHMIEDAYSEFTLDQQTDFVASLEELTKQLKRNLGTRQS